MQTVLLEGVLDVGVEAHEFYVVHQFVDVVGLEEVLGELLTAEVLHWLEIPSEVLDGFAEELCTHAALVIDLHVQETLYPGQEVIIQGIPLIESVSAQLQRVLPIPRGSPLLGCLRLLQ